MKSKKKRTYYYLPVDCYGQPRGDIWTEELTAEEAEAWERAGRYIFKSYKAALYRAMD